MSTTHKGNMLNEITFEEHDGTNNAKKTVVLSGYITLDHYIEGEDQTHHVMKTEQQFAYTTLTSNTTLAVNSAPCFLHRIFIGAYSCPSIIVYDGVTPNGNIVARFNAGFPVGSYEFNVSLSTGCTLDSIAGGAGVTPFITVSSR